MFIIGFNIKNKSIHIHETSYWLLLFIYSVFLNKNYAIHIKNMSNNWWKFMNRLVSSFPMFVVPRLIFNIIIKAYFICLNLKSWKVNKSETSFNNKRKRKKFNFSFIILFIIIIYLSIHHFELRAMLYSF